MKKSDITVLVDMDDTIENLCDAWVGYLNEKYDTDVKPENVVEWDMSKAFPTINKVAVYGALLEHDLWARVTPKPDAQKYLKQLIDDGYNVYLCTSSAYEVFTDKMQTALIPHFPYLSWKNIITTHNKHLIRGDILIDDGLHNLDDSRMMCLLYDTPHNRTDYEVEHPNTTRVYNWEEIYNIIDSVCRGMCECGENLTLSTTEVFAKMRERVCEVK